MDLTYLFDYVNLLTLGICLCVGYSLKTAFVWFPNKYIPLAALTMGGIINSLTNLETGINAAVVLGGMISGLASTGLYEMMRNLLNRDGSLPGMPDRK
ncbi:holin [Lachnospiraceae bacterium WCA-9-b2]|uniref:Holin n=1 Tax=Sporofaciens musculi TaxID=2681861 RepID=A0A7X3MF28_9FIRM|nr:phage holin family protein [Sporofaciens musculi]MXP75172.1 holin [Sporofaciens musculi]